MMTREGRRPEDFLELVERARRGRLKVYLGFAAGVGKTYRMLEEAHTLKKRGVDVVIGLVEPHGRADTAALIDGIEVVPRKKIEYRGVLVEEMDLEAVLARRPHITIVDEVAHTNAPGSRHRRRYQDVQAICEAGFNVICAFNVQHLESLKDLVERETGVTVRETVPDTFLRQADQVVTLDLSVEDLVERLHSGKIYTIDKVAWALQHFFKDHNLRTLRELVLREVAESVERSGNRPEGPEPAGTTPVAWKIMVCLSSYSPRAAALLRRGSRMAGRLSTDWYVVYVETPEEAPCQIDATIQRHLHDNIQIARELGGEVAHIKGRDPVRAILEFAHDHGVGHLIVGRSHQPWWKRFLGIDFVQRIVREATDVDVQVVAFEEPERS